MAWCPRVMGVLCDFTEHRLVLRKEAFAGCASSRPGWNLGEPLAALAWSSPPKPDYLPSYNTS